MTAISNRTITTWGLRIALFVLIAITWQFLADRTDNLLIPTFTGMVGGFWDLTIVTGRLWEPLYISNQALVIGFALSVLVGIPLGLAAGRSRMFERIINPYVALILAVPVAPLIPIVIIALGLGLSARVLIVFVFGFIFITVNTRAGIRGIDPSLIEMATSFGASEPQIWRKILIPGAVPGIFAGLILGLGRSVGGMVVVELLLVASGVGRILLQFSGRLEPELVFAVVAAIVLEAVILLSIMGALQRRLVPWAEGV